VLGAPQPDLQLAEAKDLLAPIEDRPVEQQVHAATAKRVACLMGASAQGHAHIVVRSLFGALPLASPRRWHRGCHDQPARTFQPLAELLPERTALELAYLQARFAALVSYGITWVTPSEQAIVVPDWSLRRGNGVAAG
jgi:hypothetical protein